MFAGDESRDGAACQDLCGHHRVRAPSSDAADADALMLPTPPSPAFEPVSASTGAAPIGRRRLPSFAGAVQQPRHGVPAGIYLPGRGSGLASTAASETPAHSVELGFGFYPNIGNCTVGTNSFCDIHS